MNITKAEDIQKGHVLVMGPVRMKCDSVGDSGAYFDGPFVRFHLYFDAIQLFLDQGATVERPGITPEKRRELIKEVAKPDRPTFKKGQWVWLVSCDGDGDVTEYRWDAALADFNYHRQCRLFVTKAEAIAASPKIKEAWGE